RVRGILEVVGLVRAPAPVGPGEGPGRARARAQPRRRVGGGLELGFGSDSGRGVPAWFGHRSATLNLALRARGLTATSWAVAVTGFLVRTVSLGALRKGHLTRRSSRE